MNKEFNILNVSSKFAICGVPLRADTYRNCSFGCKYCFAEGRGAVAYSKDRQIGNLKHLERLLKRIFDDKKPRKGNFLDTLVADRITWHVGGMSDPFQHCEKELGITKKMIELGNKYGVTMLFSTKSDTVYDAPIDPKLHSFQMSFSSLENKELEPNVPSLENRKRFYKELKDKGFKVGIRIQPFIPNVTTLELIETFLDADHFTIEGIKLISQNKKQVADVLELCRLKEEDFTRIGLLNLKPQIRENSYAEFIRFLEDRRLSYSIADNDMHHLSTSNCCCGDSMVHKATKFNSTHLLKQYGLDYTLENVQENLGGYSNCVARSLFTSNRREGCSTVCDFYQKRFDRKSSPFSPKFLYAPRTTE